MRPAASARRDSRAAGAVNDQFPSGGPRYRFPAACGKRLAFGSALAQLIVEAVETPDLRRIIGSRQGKGPAPRRPSRLPALFFYG